MKIFAIILILTISSCRAIKVRDANEKLPSRNSVQAISEPSTVTQKRPERESHFEGSPTVFANFNQDEPQIRHVTFHHERTQDKRPMIHSFRPQTTSKPFEHHELVSLPAQFPQEYDFHSFNTAPVHKEFEFDHEHVHEPVIHQHTEHSLEHLPEFQLSHVLHEAPNHQEEQDKLHDISSSFRPSQFLGYTDSEDQHGLHFLPEHEQHLQSAFRPISSFSEEVHYPATFESSLYESSQGHTLE